MSTDKRLNKRLPERVRREDTPGIRIDSGPFIGIIRNNIDPTRAGRLQVWIPDLGGNEDDPKSWRTVSYASPYYGTTYQPQAAVNNKFTDVAHSYGMWAVVPDIGNQVICTFIAGDPNRGYWFACINPNLSHHMVPALAAGNQVDNSLTDSSIQSKYDPNTSKWPVSEFNENIATNISASWINNAKPVHEFQANILIQQGLDRDGMRGAIGSSSQRESPSTVFGISTPGRPLNDPMDKPDFQTKLQAGTLTAADTAVSGRKGGHTFVMDDGDQIGLDQLFRLRTAGGHQILMNDSERVMYLANSDGSVWLEFTGGGHINVFSAAGINMRTDGEFNIHAGKDINMHSGGSIKFKADTSINSQTKDYTIKAGTSIGIQAGKVGILADGALSFQSANGGWLTDGKLALQGSKILLNTEAPQAVPVIADLKTNKQTDTGWDDQKGIWTNQADVFESIATITPAHEPWPRAPGKSGSLKKVVGQFAAAPQPAKPTSVCALPGQTLPVSIANITPSGGNNEAILESALTGYGITDKTEFASIMSQCAHESGNFKFVKELGADSYFTKYEGRADLGNTQPGDGLKYKGRGFIQITGRDIYTQASAYLGIDLVNQPQLAEDPLTAAKLVLFFFFQFKKSRTAGINWADVTAVTRLVNGGTNGLADRVAKFTAYQQKYAAGIVTIAGGGVLTDGNGSPVTTGSGKLDPGPEIAKSKQVVSPAPGEAMKSQDAPTPGAIVATESKIPGLIPTQMKALMIEIGFAEADSDYTAQDTDVNRVGRYAVNAIILRDNGYIKPDYVKKYSAAAIFQAGAWTGKDGINDVAGFASARGTQDTLMETVLNEYYTSLIANRGIQIQDDVCTVAGMMAVAYFLRDSERGFLSGKPADQAKFWREQGNNITNAQKETPDSAYNQGRYAIDVLSITPAGTSGVVGTNAPLTSGINPDDVLTFTNRSGDRQHFDAATGDFKDRLLQAARDYKAATGKKLTISSTVRTQAEQDAIYNGWIAAGGSLPNTPTVNVPPYGNISRPVKVIGNHGLGIAADIGTAAAAEMNSMGLLAKYGLYLFDPIGDPPHVQLKPEFRPPNLAVIQTLPGNAVG